MVKPHGVRRGKIRLGSLAPLPKRTDAQHEKLTGAHQEKLVRIQNYHAQAFAKFLTKLSKMPDGDGSVLDHSILLYGSNMSNSNAHDHYPLPNVLVGGGRGRLKGGQHIVAEDHTPMTNLLLTVLDKVGVSVAAIGDSTGRLSPDYFTAV